MHTKIFKYPLSITDHQVVAMRKDAIILSVAVQREKICLWAMVIPDAPLVDRHIRIVGTGHGFNVPSEGIEYHGTVLMHRDYLVWHVFEEIIAT